MPVLAISVATAPAHMVTVPVGVTRAVMPPVLTTMALLVAVPQLAVTVQV